MAPGTWGFATGQNPDGSAGQNHGWTEPGWHDLSGALGPGRMYDGDKLVGEDVRLAGEDKHDWPEEGAGGQVGRRYQGF